MVKLSQKIIKDIKKKGLKHKPKWQFALKRGMVWLALSLAILLGAIAVSMIIFQLYSVEWDVLSRITGGRLPLFFKVAPYFWALVAAVLFVFIYFDFKQTRKGHRYGAPTIVGGALCLSLLLGVVLFNLRGPDRVEDFLREKVPPYQHIRFDSQDAWGKPEQGLLGGEVSGTLNGDTFYLVDFKNNQWEVIFLEDDRRSEFLLREGNRVKVIGEKSGEFEFQAEEVRPWDRREMPRREPKK